MCCEGEEPLPENVLSVPACRTATISTIGESFGKHDAEEAIFANLLDGIVGRVGWTNFLWLRMVRARKLISGKITNCGVPF